MCGTFNVPDIDALHVLNEQLHIVLSRSESQFSNRTA